MAHGDLEGRRDVNTQRQLLRPQTVAYDRAEEQQNFTGSTVGILEILLLFLPVDDDDEVWLSSKSPPLTLLEGDVALLLFKAIINL